MIQSFGNRLAQDLFDDRASGAVRRFPPELRRAVRRKLLYLHDAAELRDLRVPPGNRLEALRGRWKGFHAIRINDQWRVVFQWATGNASAVQVVDYHRGAMLMRQPKNPFHPGEILLEEFLKPGGISQTAFAEPLGWTRARSGSTIPTSSGDRRTSTPRRPAG